MKNEYFPYSKGKGSRIDAKEKIIRREKGHVSHLKGTLMVKENALVERKGAPIRFE